MQVTAYRKPWPVTTGVEVTGQDLPPRCHTTPAGASLMGPEITSAAVFTAGSATSRTRCSPQGQRRLGRDVVRLLRAADAVEARDTPDTW